MFRVYVKSSRIRTTNILRVFARNSANTTHNDDVFVQVYTHIEYK